MRKTIVLLVIFSLAFAGFAFGEKGKKSQWAVGGIVENVKVYDANEAHGYILRIDVKRPNDKIKKVYTKKETKFIDAAGKAKNAGNVKQGKPIQIKYKKSGDDFIATEVTIL